MRCPDCEYELRDESQECPRCEFRRAAAPTPAAAEPPAPPPAPRRAGAAKWVGALLAVVLLASAGIGLLSRPQRPEAQVRAPEAQVRAPEAQVRALFAAADGPCRHGEEVPCQDSMKKIRALDDQPDASLLLADLKVAAYLHTLRDGDRLSARWQSDQITQPELTALGNVAYGKGLRVYRSLWISADIKRNDVAVPELVFGGAKLPSPTDAAEAGGAHAK